MMVAPDVSTLTALLQHHVDPAAECVAVTRAAAGNSQETWFLAVAGVEAPTSLVLRRSAAAGTLDWSDRAVEVDVLSAVRHAGLPVPRVWWWEPDGGTLERAYLVMDRADGHGADLRDPAVADELATDLGRWLARLHRLAEAPESLRPELGRDGASTADASRRQVELWTGRARASAVAPPILLALAGWLAATVPDDGADARLLWGDPGPYNVLTDDAGHVTALLDWELAHVGHPLFDVGAARWSCLGQLDRDALTMSYETESGVAVDHQVLGWFEVLACVSRSVMLCDGVRAALDGRAHDPNVAGLAVALVSANMIRAARIAWAATPGVVGAADPPTTPLRPTAAETGDIVARFLTADVLPVVSDPRVRRGLKISAALLTSASEDGPGAIASADTDWVDAERTGRLTGPERQRLVDEMAVARRRHRPLIELYGPTVDIGDGADG